MNKLMSRKIDGGLGLVNIKVKHKALICSWVTECERNAHIRNLAEYFLGTVVNNEIVWCLNLTRKDSE